MGASQPHMRPLFAVTCLVLLGARSVEPRDVAWQRDALAPRDSALHALNRLGYGPRPVEVDRVAAMGVMHWIDQQLEPERLPDRVLARREKEFQLLHTDDAELAEMFQAARQERQRERAAGMLDPAGDQQTP